MKILPEHPVACAQEVMAASLQEAGALEKKPSEEDLDAISKEVGGNWKSLLIHLGVPNTRIEGLLEENNGNPTRACFKGLVFWREGNKPCKPATWSVLLEALEKGAEKREYARDLREEIVAREGKRVQQLTPERFQRPSSKFQMSETSQKRREIVDKYRNGDIFAPIILDLEDDLDKFMTKTFRSKLLSADPGCISELYALMRRKYRNILHTKQASVPNTADGLYEFIEEKSTPYEILLVHHAVEVLEDEDLKKNLQEYESKLAKHLQNMLVSCKRRRVTLPLRKGCTHMAVVISEEQVLLAVVLELKEYFSKYLQLEETLFEGFEEGCTVLFFSILTVDAALLSPKVLSHLSELKRMFGMTHLIVFGYFACDLEKATIELVETEELTKVSQEEAKVEGKRLFPKSDSEGVVLLETERGIELTAVRSSHQTELENVTREKAELERDYAEMEIEKAEMENNVIDNFPATCQDELRSRISSYTQAARDLVQHRDIGMEWFRKAAHDLDKAFKCVAVAKIAGSGLGIAGAVLSVVGGALLLGGVTAPAGIPLLVVGAVLGVGGGITGVGATIGDVVNNRRALKRANAWIRQGSELCRELIRRHDDYHEELDAIREQYGATEEEVIETTIGPNHRRIHLEINDEEFRRADDQALLAITEWKKALEMGAEAMATAFVAGAITGGVVGGVEAGAEAGAAVIRVARVAVQATGGVVIGLSAVFVVVDLALIGKTAYDVKKNMKGTELANKLRQAADDMEKETAQLRPLANFANDIII